MTGEPTYIELGVTDADAARTFYGALLGWHPAVDDLAASLAQVTQLGGTVEGEIHVEDGFGRWCECADDQGVRFGLRQQHI